MVGRQITLVGQRITLLGQMIALSGLEITLVGLEIHLIGLEIHLGGWGGPKVYGIPPCLVVVPPKYQTFFHFWLGWSKSA